jgi:hypothetical protein
MKKGMLAIFMASIMLMMIGSVCCTVSADDQNDPAPAGILNECTIKITLTGDNAAQVEGKRLRVGLRESTQITNGACEVKVSPGLHVIHYRWTQENLKVGPRIIVANYGLFSDGDSTEEVRMPVFSYGWPFDLGILDAIANFIKDLVG